MSQSPSSNGTNGLNTPKRAVNLTLSHAIVNQAKEYTGNLSATVEALLVEFVKTQQRDRHEKFEQVRQSMAEWNVLNESIGSFADEYSTL
jgi:antitoxin CcdA